jgi:DNA recombination protein RmuC
MHSSYIKPAAVSVTAIVILAGAIFIWRLQSVIVALRTAKAESDLRLAAAAEKVSRIPALEGSLDNTRSELADLRIKHAKLQEAHDQEIKTAEEKLALLREAKQQMADQFKLLGQEIIAQQGDTLRKQSVEQLDGVLAPLREKIVDFQQQLSLARSETSKERAALGEQIRAVLDASHKMSSETNTLTQALKGKSQTQGAWGEMVLQTILQNSGLREGEEYVFQESRANEEGEYLRPDVVVNLPSGEKVVIDSKVSLSAFHAYVKAETDEDRNMELSLHLSSIKKHIEALSDKEYQHLFSSHLNFVIMFVPIEGALAVALAKEPDLTSLAAKKNVAIVTPTTLVLALKTIANLWHVQRRNQHAEEIADRAGKLYDKFVGFVRDLESVGSRLNQAQNSYTEAMNKLSKGGGNLIRQVEKVRELGAKTGKNIPEKLLDVSEAEAVTIEATVDTPT